MKVNKEDRICAFCEKAVAMYDDSVMLCSRNGIVDSRYKCAKFSYDPIKRRPPAPLKSPELEYIDIDSI